MNEKASEIDAATAKVLAGIGRPEVEGRYPNHTHFVPADHPQHGLMATQALFDGDPVVLVYPDGREMLLTPEHTAGIAALFLLLAGAWLKLRSHNAEPNVVQLPPRTRIEARDSTGLPIAA